MTGNQDEITLKQAAEYVAVGDMIRVDQTELARESGGDAAKANAILKRRREIAEATAVLEAMLAASRAGKVVTG